MDRGDVTDRRDLARIARQLLPLLPLVGGLTDAEVSTLTDQTFDGFGREELILCARVAEATAEALREEAEAFPPRARTGT